MSTYLSLLEVNDYKSFKGNHKFYFCGSRSAYNRQGIPQASIFLGNNGTGKTNLLKIIANLQPVRNTINDTTPPPQNISHGVDIIQYVPTFTVNVGEQVNTAVPSKDSVWHRPKVVERHRPKNSREKDYSVNLHFLKINNSASDLRMSKWSAVCGPETKLIGKATISKAVYMGYTPSSDIVTFDANELDQLVIYGYGVNRFADSKRNLNSETTCDTLFSNHAPLINFEEWLLQLHTASKDATHQCKAQRRINLIKKLLKESKILPEVMDYRVYVDDQLHSSILFQTKDGEFNYQELGYGYQCMMAWLFDFIKKLFDRYPDSENPLHEPAVLLIDEIDLHLHPQWQRRVMRDLCEMFPKTQFIVTTHSPLVIQSLSDLNLFILRNEEGVTKVKSYPAQTFQGWSVEEILDELMDMGADTRPKEYEEARAAFESAMNSEDVDKGLKAYEKLKKMLHPGSAEAEILDIDKDQLEAAKG